VEAVYRAGTRILPPGTSFATLSAYQPISQECAIANNSSNFFQVTETDAFLTPWLV
jgi:hypothetical protein